MVDWEKLLHLTYLRFLVCLHFSIGRYHHCGVLALRRVSISSELKSFLLSMCIDAPESNTNYLSSKDFEEGRRRCPGRVKRSFILTVELVDTFRQVPCHPAGASFLVQGFVLCPFLKSENARSALVRFTLLNDASRWTLPFPNFDVVPQCPWRI